jgi:hypothetical protein
MFVCVCMYVLNKSTTPCHTENSTARSLDSGLTFRIHIDATEASPCRRGRPRRSLWSVCTYRSRLSTTVALERLTAVWAIPRKCCRVVCRPCLCLSTKQKRHAQSAREKCMLVYVCVCERERERERNAYHTLITHLIYCYVCACVGERDREREIKMRKTPGGGVFQLGWVKSDETLGTDVVVRSLY